MGRLIGLVGALYWVYHTLDNVDGSHARRTGTSGPAGEFLDHGSDVMTCSLPALGISLALNLPPALILTVTSIVALSLWATLWCMYYTGVFVMRPVSDTEAAVAVTIVLLTGGLVGREPLVARWGPGVSIASLLAISVGLAFARQFFGSLARPDTAVSRLPAVSLVASHLLLVTWYVLAEGAVSIIAIGILLALAAGRAGQRIILARLLRLPVPGVDWLSLFLSCLGPGTLLLGVLVAEMQAVLAWSLIAIAGSVQLGMFGRSFVELRRRQREGHPHVG
jgi:phosphatidylglycerophosphate synthase